MNFKAKSCHHWSPAQQSILEALITQNAYAISLPLELEVMAMTLVYGLVTQNVMDSESQGAWQLCLYNILGSKYFDPKMNPLKFVGKLHI